MTVFTHRRARSAQGHAVPGGERHRGYVLVGTATEKSFSGVQGDIFKIMRGLKLKA